MKTDFTVFLLKKGFARYEPQSLQVAVQNIATAEYEKVRQPFFYTYLKKGGLIQFYFTETTVHEYTYHAL
jgi:hypothetical protein